MSSDLKVTFIDNASSQYDVNADEIRGWKTKLKEDEIGKRRKRGKLYLGDRFAATFLQLKHRDCYTVINCAKDLHGYSKEDDVEYLNIDPLVPSNETKDNHFEECYQFINDETNDGNNVLITCLNGLNKSAAILLYFIMKKKSINLADSFRLIKKYRDDIKPNPELIRLLMKHEKEIFGSNSIYLGGKSNRDIIYGDDPHKSAFETHKGGCCGPSKPLPSSPPIISVIILIGCIGALFGGLLYASGGKL
jgi:hypothetical protein